MLYFIHFLWDSIFFFIGRIASILFPRQMIYLIHSIRLKIYNGWISGKFKHFGKGIVIYPPFRFKGTKYISIGNCTHFGKACILTAWDKWGIKKYSPSITIGKNCRFGDYNHITATHNIEIGNNVLTGRWVTISDNNHGSTDYESLQIPPLEREVVTRGAVIIGNNVWIGDKVTILSGVTIGEGAVIGANAVVTSDIPQYSVAVGNPAKIIKQYAC